MTSSDHDSPPDAGAATGRTGSPTADVVPACDSAPSSAAVLGRVDGRRPAETVVVERGNPPGTEAPRRFRPRLRYELIGCGLHGHSLLGLDVADVRVEDSVVLREHDGLRWHRCLRCDSWLPLLPPEGPTEAHLPDREHIELPLRGRPLRDRYVLRLIAVDRLVHFIVLAVLAAAVFVFLADRDALSDTFYRVLDAVQGAIGGPNGGGRLGLLDELSRAFAAKSSTIWLVGLVLAAYALLEGLEAVGLWYGRRWAEYLTFIATALLLIPEIYELTETISPTKILTMLINLAVLAYLLVAKRLFGLRGGGKAEAAEYERDSGWPALERSLPHPLGDPAGPS